MNFETMSADFEAMSEDEVREVKRLAQADLERRDNLRDIPKMVEDLAKNYKSGGGDISVLTEALSVE